ncbi:unnamed protein product [Sphagnum jensenii]|uniref:Protein kinase domain-containing protein n=1 Tax=Sphagnum jensenii TaxID=128206 RepID=A0ABP1BNR8_9BRYO
MDISTLEAQLTEEPNVTKAVPSVCLELATKSMMHIQSLISPDSSNSVPINHLQCQYIFDKLCETLKSAKECICGPSLQDNTISDCIFQNLAQTAMEDAEFSIIDRKAQEDRKWLLSRLMQVGSSESENLIKRLDIFSIRGAFLQQNASFVLDPWKVEWKSIKRFRRSQIGKGSYAVVHKVVWLGKYFAEKSFPFPENENFRKEVSFLAGLSHPNILPLFCYATCTRYCSLVMELMDEDLNSLIRNRLGPKTSLDPPFELLEAIDIMLQVAEGMKYLHQNKVMHRDLKAENILVKCDGGHVYAKVADLGSPRQ